MENEVHSPIPGRNTRLQEKHFAERRYPKRGRCGCFGCKKGINGKNKDTSA